MEGTEKATERRATCSSNMPTENGEGDGYELVESYRLGSLPYDKNKLRNASSIIMHTTKTKNKDENRNKNNNKKYKLHL